VAERCGKGKSYQERCRSYRVNDLNRSNLIKETLDMTTQRSQPGPIQPEDDRAQPGDVLGIETDGEQTHLGDTREDEDERREDAEEDARKNNR
jgi:hypothetical protein